MTANIDYMEDNDEDWEGVEKTDWSSEEEDEEDDDL